LEKKIWKFKGDKLLRLTNSLGNLLPLSGSINSSLQNDSFDDKKNIKKDSCGSILRNGYKNGSYSEIEVSQYDDWTPETIKRRGLILLNFLENRWNIKIGDEEIKTSILGIDFIK
jgi:ankyrin repeat protein